MLCGRSLSFSGSLVRSSICCRSSYELVSSENWLFFLFGIAITLGAGSRHTWLRSIKPAVKGLRILDIFGGHFKMKFLKRSEYLK